MAKKKRVKVPVTKHLHRGQSLGFGRDKARKAKRVVPPSSASEGDKT